MKRTARAALEGHREYHRREARACTTTLKALEERFPELLDFEASFVLPTLTGVRIEASAWDKTERKGFFGRAIEAIETRLGTPEADLVVDSYNRSLSVVLPKVGSRGKPFTVKFTKSLDRKCKKVRVTHVIDVCGSVDETQYDSVEYLAEEV